MPDQKGGPSHRTCMVCAGVWRLCCEWRSRGTDMETSRARVAGEVTPSEQHGMEPIIGAPPASTTEGTGDDDFMRVFDEVEEDSNLGKTYDAVLELVRWVGAQLDSQKEEASSCLAEKISGLAPFPTALQAALASYGWNGTRFDSHPPDYYGLMNDVERARNRRARCNFQSFFSLSETTDHGVSEMDQGLSGWAAVDPRIYFGRGSEPKARVLAWFGDCRGEWLDCNVINPQCETNKFNIHVPSHDRCFFDVPGCFIREPYLCGSPLHGASVDRTDSCMSVPTPYLDTSEIGESAFFTAMPPQFPSVDSGCGSGGGGSGAAANTSGSGGCGIGDVAPVRKEVVEEEEDN